MKKIIALGLLFFSACNTGNVQVGSGTSSQPGTAGGTQKTNSIAKDSQKIFFEKIVSRNGIPQYVTAISFNAVGAKNTYPFSIPMGGNQVFSAAAPFSLNGDNVTTLRNVDVGTDALLATSLDSLESNQVYGFPRAVAAFSLNNDNSTIAWLDQSGVLALSEIATGKVETLDTTAAGANVVLNHVQWNADNSYLLARADNGEALLFKDPSEKPTLLQGVNAASFSNDGTQLAFFTTANKTLHILDLATAKDNVAGTFESSDIHDLSWNSATSVSYWTTLGSGAKELRVFSDGQEITVALLTFPNAIKDGVVCPAWIGNDVYFGNYDSGEYVIEQSSLSGKNSKSLAAMQIFAEMPEADLGEGFVCPKVAK